MNRKKVLLILMFALAVSASSCNKLPETVEQEPTPTISNAIPTTQPAVPEYPAENKVSAYNTSLSDYTLEIDTANKLHDVSDLLMGIFMEDINFAADGGLYAEKIVNRSFEYTDIAKKDQMYGWQTTGTVNASVTINDSSGSINENNTNYLVLTNTSGEPAGVENSGFLDGISVEENESYDFSIYARSPETYTGSLTIRIVCEGEILGETIITGITGDWMKFESTLTSSASAHKNVKLQILIENGSLALDMVSLFPQNTYKNRKNGLRADLATMLEELKPSFLRFPGGCVIEGYDYETMYNWKDSIGVGKDGEPLLFNGTYGDVAARKQGINVWTDIRLKDDANPSYMTYGLGFYEYFLLAEDLGAVGVPVVNCGMYCQGRNGVAVPIGTDEFQTFIQDALDLVEFCRGSADTKWGAVRIAMGHEEPFTLKYIGIGNENWNNNFYKRYELFVDAFEKATIENPALFEGIELIYSAGPDDATSGTSNYESYQNAQRWLRLHLDKDVLDYAGATDQHYYNTPDWFLQNTDYYDEEKYSRDSLTDTVHGGAIPVFIGEYAARSNTLKAALAEAAYMTGIERNSDIIRMAAYAPLFGNLTALHWSPNLIWFNNHLCTGSVNYYMQKLFSTNISTGVLNSTLSGAEIAPALPAGKVGVGTWNTTAEFDNIKVISNDTGELLGEQNFDTNTFASEWLNVADGKFKVTDGKLRQTNVTTIAETTGSVAYYGGNDWNNYTYTVEATKLSGSEGFLIPFVVRDKNEHYFWNIGGWNNTVSCLQQVSGGAKSGQIADTVKKCNIKTGRTYTLKVTVTDTNVKCYIDDTLYIDYTFPITQSYEAYQVAGVDENGDIILKLVNVTEENRTFAIHLAGEIHPLSEAFIYQVKGTSLANDNLLGATEDCIMEEFSVSGVSTQFNFTVPQYSATVIRIKTK